MFNFVEIFFMMETLSTGIISPIKFTNKAVVEINRLMEESTFDKSKKLRVGVKGGGCSGLSYVLGFEDQLQEDEVYESDGLEFIMNPSQALYLYGMEVNWDDGLNSRGFIFSNPNATKTCGCGTSFSI